MSAIILSVLADRNFLKSAVSQSTLKAFREMNVRLRDDIVVRSVLKETAGEIGGVPGRSGILEALLKHCHHRMTVRSDWSVRIVDIVQWRPRERLPKGGHSRPLVAFGG
jgi:hypothetical protein